MTFYDWMTANENVLSAGKGLYSPLHIVLIILCFLWLITAFILFKKFPTFAKKFTFWIVIIMMTSRIFRMIFRIAVGADSFFQAMPWQLCHIMCFAIGILFLSKSKKFITPIATFAFFGGVLTFLFGDYYMYNILTFYDIESILLHIFLPTVSIYYLATKQITYTYASLNQTIVFLLALVCYGEIGNLIFPDANIMYIKQNGLPFKIFPGSHILTYIFLVAVSFGIAYLILYIKNKKKNKK